MRVVMQPSGDLVLSGSVVENNQSEIEGLSLRRIAWRRLKQDRVAMAGGAAMVLIVLVAAFASQLNDLLGQQPSPFHSSLLDPDTTLPYGSLGGVVVLMLWLYITALVIILGAELNAELEQQTVHDTTVGEPRPMGERRAEAADTVE